MWREVTVWVTYMDEQLLRVKTRVVHARYRLGLGLLNERPIGCNPAFHGDIVEAPEARARRLPRLVR